MVLSTQCGMEVSGIDKETLIPVVPLTAESRLPHLHKELSQVISEVPSSSGFLWNCD